MNSRFEVMLEKMPDEDLILLLAECLNYASKEVIQIALDQAEDAARMRLLEVCDEQ